MRGLFSRLTWPCIFLFSACNSAGRDIDERLGQSLMGSTTAENFASRATTFFNAYGTTLQTIGAQMLPTSAAALAALARADTAEGASTRAALLALSVVRVDVSVATVAQVRLYDATTGQGNITGQWIDDRAAFTAAHYQKLQGLGGNVPGSQNIRYFDAASATEVLVGSGAVINQRVQVFFGGATADAFSGNGMGDCLYGGAGNDSLLGASRAEQLQGGGGSDSRMVHAGRGYRRCPKAPMAPSVPFVALGATTPR